MLATAVGQAHRCRMCSPHREHARSYRFSAIFTIGAIDNQERQGGFRESFTRKNAVISS